MKHVFATCCLFLATIALQAQDLTPFITRTERGYTFGYRDSDNKTVIEPKYQGAKPFGEGLAPINIGGRYSEDAQEGLGLTLGGKWGYIDEAGNIVIAPKYEVAEPFSEGLAAVRIDGKVGYIDRAGNIVIAPKYADGRDFQDGVARVNVGGRYIEHDDITFFGQWGIIDAKGNTIIEPKYEEIARFSEGLAAVTVKDSESSLSLVGFIDNTGREVIRPQYMLGFDDRLPVFEGGKAEVHSTSYSRTIKIDKTGKEIVDEDRIAGEIQYYLQNGDYAEAVKMATEHANNGLPKVMNQLASIYYNGEGVSPNHVEALRWFKKAAEAGDATAMNNVGILYYHGADGVSQDTDEAFKWFKKGADKGEASSIYMLGVMHHYGQGTAENTEEGTRLIKKAAELGHELAIQVMESAQ